MTSEPAASSGEQAAAVVLGLPLRLEVVFDEEAEQKFVRLVSGDAIKRELAMFWTRNGFGYVGLVLGIYGSVMGGMVFVACMILTLAIWLFQQHRVVAKTIAAGGCSSHAPMRATVEITEEGIAETDRGIESKFGWSAMNQWILSEDVLYIQLTNGKWALLPGKGMEPVFCLEDLASFLKIKGVLGRVIRPGDKGSRALPRVEA